MKNTTIHHRTEQINLFPSENQKSIDKHHITSSHLEAAAKYHIESEKHNENGDYGKATQSKIIAKEHLRLASEALKEEIYHNDMYNEIII